MNVSMRWWPCTSDLLAFVLFVLLPSAVDASVLVAPNAYAATNGTADQFSMFQSNEITFQWVFPASDFASLPIGTEITSIGFRRPTLSVPAPSASQSYAQWNLQLSKPALPFPALSSTFANNLGAGLTLVRSGPLTIPQNSFSGGVGPNSFFDIFFDTPYTYQGGDTLITLRHTDAPGGGTNGFGVDANHDGDNLSSAVGALSRFGDPGAFTATTGFLGRNYPITQFGFGQPAAVPEPSTFALAALGLLSLGFVGWRRRRR